MSRVFEYFVVCGLGPEIRTVDGSKGFHGNGVMYLPSLLDQYPPSTHSLYPPPPPQLSTCVLPAGVEFFSSGFDVNDESTFPRSYPIVLTGTVGTYPSRQEPLMQKMAQSWFMGGPSSNQKTTTTTTTPSLLADWNSYASSSKEGGGAVFDLEAVVISVNDTVSGTFSVIFMHLIQLF